MGSAIRTVSLSKNFRRVSVLEGLDLEVPEGAIYALIGPNGAGKTTTLKILMNLLRPTGGNAEVLGVDSSQLSPREFADIGYVSENQEMPDWMTVDYLLEYLKPFYPTWDCALAEQLIRQFDLPPPRKIRQLSRGMRMKVALAASLAYRPKLIVLDEPFTGLDALVRDQLIEGLLEQAAGATVLISSHDLAEIESFASHVGYLDHGELRFSEETSGLVERFREVEITCEAPPVLPSRWPQAWLCPNTSATVLRFVDSHFDEDRTTDEVRHLFRGVRSVSFSPMSLRAIFVAFTKATNMAA
jgi:ABC-2 type transport system ATP-binding protein